MNATLRSQCESAKFLNFAHCPRCESAKFENFAHCPQCESVKFGNFEPCPRCESAEFGNFEPCSRYESAKFVNFVPCSRCKTAEFGNLPRSKGFTRLPLRNSRHCPLCKLCRLENSALCPKDWTQNSSVVRLRLSAGASKKLTCEIGFSRAFQEDENENQFNQFGSSQE